MRGAPTGNQFWKLRSKHGADKIFKTPELLWDASCEYFEWCENHPLEAEDFIKSGDYAGNKVQLSKLRAFTMIGLCRYLGVHSKYFYDFEDGLKGKNDEMSKDFSNTITRIREIIYDQKFTGAAAGLLNANIIARDLGLADKKDIHNTIEADTDEIKKLFPFAAPND